MKRLRIAFAAVVAAVGVASCTSSGSPAHDSTTSSVANGELPGSGSSSAAAGDSSTVLIDAANLPITGLQLTSSHADANSVTGRYSNADHSSVVVDTVVLFPTASAAQGAEPSIEAAAADQFDNAQVRGITSGKVYRGASGADALIVAVFAEGRAVVTLAIRSATLDAVSDAAVDMVVTSQDQLIKTNVK